MFEFFGSILFWFFIVLMFILQLINGLGIYGRGVMRDKINLYSSLATIVLAIFTWLFEGFSAFIAYSVLWLLLTYISTPIIFAFLRKMGVEPRKPHEF